MSDAAPAVAGETKTWFTDASGEKSEAGPFPPPPAFEQNQQEFYWLMAKVGKISSVLEIGSREGGALRMMVPFLAPGARVCSIDIGERHPEWQNGRETVSYLKTTIEELREQGFDAQVFIGNSQMLNAVTWATERGPFDLVIIDGDHSELGVERDWNRYGKLGAIVAFHDITLPTIAPLWAEIKASGVSAEEMIAIDGTGIGLVRT